MADDRPILLTGATGFVGACLWADLNAAGYEVRSMTRRADRAGQRWPDRHWVQADLESGAGVEAALEGCRAAFYLIHGMGSGADYRQREISSAERFARLARVAGVERVVYLGGVAPSGAPSEHLRSRLDVGEILRRGPVPALELRASMIVGYGSLSWMMVRDLAARLPMMVLPRWLRARTQPVAIDDVVVALVRGLTVPLKESADYDLPGPETLSGRAILEAAAQAQHLRSPLILEVPVVSPRLSTHWVRLVTRADWSIARELVLGLGADLIARNDEYWHRIGHETLLPYRLAAAKAVEAERLTARPTGVGGAVEQIVATVCGAYRQESDTPPPA